MVGLSCGMCSQWWGNVQEGGYITPHNSLPFSLNSSDPATPRAPRNVQADLGR